MANNQYQIELAVSGRAKCKECGGPISKNSLRIAKKTKGNYFSGSADDTMMVWYHADHFFDAMRRARATTKKVTKTADLHGFTSLPSSDKALVRRLIATFTHSQTNEEKTPKRARRPSIRKETKESKKENETSVVDVKNTYLENVTKYWEIRVNKKNKSFFTRWGPLGKPPRESTVKAFSELKTLQSAVKTLIASKIKKGYGFV